MRSSTLSLLCGLLSFGSIVDAGWFATEANQNCVYACDQALTYVHFKDEKKDKSNSFVPKCSSHLRVQSLVYCARKYCPAQDVVPGLNAQNYSCEAETGMRYPSYEKLLQEIPAAGDKSANITTYKKKAKKTDAPLTAMAIPSSTLFDNFLATVTLYYNNFSLSRYLGYSLWGFWGLAILIGITYRLASGIASHQIFSGAIQRTLLVPALFNGRHQEKFKPFGSLPTRLETTVISLYFVMIFIYMFPGFGLVEPNLWWPKDSVQLCRQIADRAANIAIANIPILFVFGTRNDPFLWLTGWSYSAFNTFHRWIARIVLLVLIVHATCQTLAATYTGPGEYAEDLAKTYFQYGIAAITIYGTMLGTSSTFRRTFYDAWLITHIVLAAALLGALFYHVSIWEGRFNGFIWASVAFWSFDRVLRLGRILFNSRSLKKANISYNGSSDMVRLDVTDLIRGKAAAGHTYYYVYVPSMVGWQNHPFSLCTWTAAEPATPTESVSGKNELDLARPAPSKAMGQTKQTFLIRPQTGFTRRLRQKLISSNKDAERNTDVSSTSMRVIIEGPYGSQHNLSKHTNVTMVAGGSGISAMISYAHALLPGNSKATSVHLIWAVKEAQFAEDVLHKELAALVGHPRLRLDIFVTGQSSPSTPPSEQEKPMARESTSSESMTMFSHRPDLRNLLAQDRSVSTGDLGIICCGPDKMADEVRRVTVQLLGEYGPPVEYYNESFGW